jgi:hypothetical protein
LISQGFFITPGEKPVYRLNSLLKYLLFFDHFTLQDGLCAQGLKFYHKIDI